MATPEIAAAMYTATYSGEAGNVSSDLGKALVSKGDVVVIDSFLQDRPPPIVEDPQEEAEIRIGAKSSFSYDLTTGDEKLREDLIVEGPTWTGVYWPDPPPDDQDQQPTLTVVRLDIKETNRDIETIRIEGNDGESWIDIQRIKSITFQMPTKRGPTGEIIEYWTYHLNWDNPVINGVDTSTIELGPGDTIISVS